MKTLWFKRKRYGYGLSPATWEGWLSLTVYIVLIIVDLVITRHINTPASIITGTVILVALTIGLVALSLFKGESMRWQWGNRDGHSK